MNTFKLTRRSSFWSVTLASLGCLAGTAQVLAADQIVHGHGLPSSAESVTVSYADLDLSKMAGARTLYRRIASAARGVCGEDGRRIEEQIQWRSCYQGAIADAVAAVNSPLLTAVQGGQKTAPTVTAMLSK
jgi:UrcA family protein